MKQVDQQDREFLFQGSVEDVDVFLKRHPSVFSNNDRIDFLQAAREEELLSVRANLFSWVYGVIVDWREEDCEIIRLFGEFLPGEVIVEETDEGLTMSFAGEIYSIPLTFSPNDRYITIRGIANIIQKEFEIRLFRDSYFSDTHVFVLMSCAQWQELERSHTAEVEKIFQKITPELDFP
ncbi:hypothetical protein LOZ80_02650 [Paenibacillus sp. HWE-109]|uniref:hypothetical protein n=1 Tax=Paenibacillus sp. HWE-109 TaxID=1306526 RepID=UPI001EE040ED|nr:hypothetical protein [Paenibacillus sp. HWE-109]UKS27873.1 hypothetical protein LOZ80_02650 [Paenibacillus sp. HWE-109]